MKRFWVVLLSLGLVLAFSASAFAVSADFWGHLRWRGWYNSNPSQQDRDAVGTTNAGSSAFTEQRLRLGSTLTLTEGVFITTRLDALENFWYGARTAIPTTGSSAGVITSDTEQQNIQWEIANMNFRLPFGTFMVGYTNAPLGYGTDYWQSGEGVRPIVRWTLPVGPVEIRATWEKKSETQSWGNPTLATSDADSDIYALAGRFRDKKAGLEAGAQWQYLVNNSRRVTRTATASNPDTRGYSTDLHALQPYFKGKFGPLELQAEGLYIFGDAKKYDGAIPVGQQDMKASGKGAYVNAMFTMGPAMIAAAVSYTSGDDHTTKDKMEGSLAGLFDGASSNGGSSSTKPTLIAFNTTYSNFFGSSRGSGMSATDAVNPNYLANSNKIETNNDNMWQYTLYGTFVVSPKLDFFALATLMKADQKPYNSTTNVQFISDDVGKEVNLVANYHITKELTYSVQGAYYWTGDYWKGTSTTSKVDNTYVLMHALLLEF